MSRTNQESEKLLLQYQIKWHQESMLGINEVGGSLNDHAVQISDEEIIQNNYKSNWR